VKAPLHRLCCLGLLVAERAAPDEPWRVDRIRALTVDAHPEGDLLARFDASLRGGPALVGFNTGGSDLPVLRYRALALVSWPRCLWTHICPRRDRNDGVQHDEDRSERSR
jgi:hypothetical protein